MFLLKNISLKNKITLIMLLSAIVLSAVTYLVIFFYLNNLLINREVININKLNVEQGHEIIRILEKEQLFSKILASRTRVKEYLLDPNEEKRLELLAIFSDYVKEDPSFLSLYLLDNSGTAEISTDSSFVGQDYSFRDYFKEGMLGRPHIDLLLGKTSNQFGYYFSHPVFDDNQKFLGVFVSKVDGQEIEKSLVQSEILNNSNIMLTDEFGIIIFSNREDRFLKSLGNLTETEKEEISLSKKFLDKPILPIQYDLVQQAIRSGNPSADIKLYDEEDGETEIINVSRLGEFPFFLISETGLETISSMILNVITLLVMIIILVILITFFFVYKIINLYLKPLKELIVFTKIISSGDFSQKVKINTKDEFGDLARSLNDMSTQLEDLQINLKQKILEKTKENEERLIENTRQKNALLNLLEDVEKEKSKFEQVSSKLSLATKSAQIGVWEWDVIKNIITWDDQMYKIYGLKKEDFGGAYEAWQAGLHPDDKKAGDEAIQMALRGEKDFTPIFRVVWPNGEIRYVQAYATIERDGLGKPLKMIGINFDITREKEIDKAKTEFVSLASHQLRTPLTPIRLFSEMLLNEEVGKLNPQQREYIKSIDQSSKRMIALVNDLLNVSRLELGRLKIDPVPTDILNLLKESIDEVLPVCDIKGCKIILNQPTEKLSNINIDQTLMRQVIHNLLTNAIRYSSVDNRSLISVGVARESMNYLINVKDNGIGIPKEAQSGIFEKFYRAENAIKVEGEGSGLGLYIIKMIVESMKGKIWFESPPKGEDNGTIFYISLPIAGVDKKEGDRGIIPDQTLI